MTPLRTHSPIDTADTSPMPVSRDDLAELAAQLHAASLEQAADHCPRWSALSMQAANALRELVEPSRQGRGLRGTGHWARLRRWLWWVLNPEGPR
jgi:hypothetical protein